MCRKWLRGTAKGNTSIDVAREKRAKDDRIFDEVYDALEISACIHNSEKLRVDVHAAAESEVVPGCGSQRALNGSVEGVTVHVPMTGEYFHPMARRRMRSTKALPRFLLKIAPK